MNWTLFSVSTLILNVTSLILSVILFVFGRSKLHTMWAFYNLSVAFWGFCGFFAGTILNPEISLFWWRVAHLGVATIPVFLYHATILFCNLKKKRLLNFIYLQGAIFILFIPSKYFFNGISFRFSEFFYPSFGPVYHAFFFIWISIVIKAQYELFKIFKNATDIRRTQISYLFFGLIVGFLGGITNFLPGYLDNIYPFGNLSIPIYNIIVAYAILRYRLLDLSVIVTRSSIFIFVYSLVLGIPFAIAVFLKDILLLYFGQNWWIIPLTSSTILASLGPYIYIFFLKSAENRLLVEQRNYQATLRKASLGMGQIKNLQRLLNLIVHIVTRAVRISHCGIYLLHQDSNQFVLKAYKGKNLDNPKKIIIAPDSYLANNLTNNKEPIVKDELIQKNLDFKDLELAKLEEEMSALNGDLIIPSFIEHRLLAIIVLGKKKSGKVYTQDDLVVFSILASQAALAIENAMFYEETKRTHEQLFKAEKMATIGTMADGLSHQINNRLHAMGFIAGDAIDTLKRFKGKNVTEEVQKLLDDMQNALVRIEDNVKRGGEIVQGLLTYTRKGEEGFSAVELNKLLDSSIEMVSYKVKTKQIEFVRNFNGKIPRIKGNFTQLQEVLFNIIDNANDAINQRKDELKEPDFHGRIEFEAHMVGLNRLELVVKDNGMGVKEENMRKIFTPFFTTKLSSKKGTGLGMYVIKQIIEENHKGKVEFISKYREGSTTKMLLPIYSADLNKS